MQHTYDRVSIFDTTLRDGEQGAGASMSHTDKVAIAEMLDSMGVDVIEAGFPAASEGAFKAVAAIAAVCKKARICALARGMRSDIDAAVFALGPAGPRGRIHIFIATDRQHMAVKLRLSPTAVLANITEHIAYAKQFVQDIEFSPEVATTSDVSFLYQAIDVAVAAGATVINIPDTTGYALPHEFGSLVHGVVDHLVYAPKVVVSVHCHNDRGLATANALEGLRAGARQVECTINGIGERAGNTALEEVVMALTLRPDVFTLSHGVDTTAFVAASAMVAKASGMLVPGNKAFVGANAFAHESGIHQAGVIKQAGLYEVCAPERVGAIRRLPLGKLSGKAGVAATLLRLGIVVSDVQLQLVYELLMAHADTYQVVSDAAVRTIVAELHIDVL